MGVRGGGEEMNSPESGNGCLRVWLTMGSAEELEVGMEWPGAEMMHWRTSHSSVNVWE